MRCSPDYLAYFVQIALLSVGLRSPIRIGSVKGVCVCILHLSFSYHIVFPIIFDYYVLISARLSYAKYLGR